MVSFSFHVTWTSSSRSGELRRAVQEFWEPAKQRERYDRTPRMPREKHFYEFSNQFILGDGTVVDARP
jgi:choline-sulfatase